MKKLIFFTLLMVLLLACGTVTSQPPTQESTSIPTVLSTETTKPTETSKPTDTLDPSITPPTATRTSTSTRTPTVTKTPTLIPTATLPMLKMSLSQFIASYLGMTDLQREDFKKASMGLWVNWTGIVDNVGTGDFFTLSAVYLLASSNTSVTLTDIPLEVEKTLSKGQTIHFIGRLDSVEYYITNLTIMVRDVQIIP
jgi:hypothetical protein